MIDEAALRRAVGGGQVMAEAEDA
ncbi:hypothetical protein [Streptomyces sp. NPDC015345]